MNNLDEYCGINLFIGTDKAVQNLLPETKSYALVIQTDAQGHMLKLTYYDPILGPIDVPSELTDDPKTLMKQIRALAHQRSVEPMEGSLMLHLRPRQLEALFPNLLGEYIQPEFNYAQAFLERNPTTKFDRKKTGLSHSYEYDSMLGVIQSENKDECRVVWSQTLPTQSIFENLPRNTKGAYVVVQSEQDQSAQLYYLEKSNDVKNKAQWVEDDPNLDFFEQFKFNNRSLRKSELEELGHEHHSPDDSNFYGRGNFARVKKSSAKSSNSSIKIATKVRIIQKSNKFQSQLSGRNAEIAKLSREASIVADLGLGSPEVIVGEEKIKLNMFAKGTPLNHKTAGASFKKKLDYAIDYLIEIDDLHRGEKSETNTGYAHRDLKPQNILVGKDGKFTIVDYGLATSNLHSKSKSEEVGGTLFYAPLDQATINYYTNKIQSADNSKKNQQQFSHQNSIVDRVDDESIGDFSSVDESYEATTTEDEMSEESTSFQTKSSGLPEKWNYCLLDKKLCITENYLEDDKIASLRIIYLDSPVAQEGDSIFNSQDFSQLPLPIRDLLKSSTIAPLLSGERRQETEGFFAAVLIQYKKNPHKTDAEYQQMIDELRKNPKQQQRIIQDYQRAQHQSFAPIKTSQLNELSTPVVSQEKLKPNNTTFNAKQTLLRILGRGKHERQSSSQEVQQESKTQFKPQPSQIRSTFQKLKRGLIKSKPKTALTNDSDSSELDKKIGPKGGP